MAIAGSAELRRRGRGGQVSGSLAPVHDLTAIASRIVRVP